MNRSEEVKQNPKSPSVDVESSVAGRSDSTTPKSSKSQGSAISGVLNNPNTKSFNSARPSKNDIPTVPHVNIRKVKPSDFNSYIKQITPVFERYSFNKELGAEGLQSRKSTLSITESESPTASVTNLLANNLENLQDVESPIPVHRLASTRNPYTVHLPLPSPEDDRTLEPVIELPLLETVPSIFFDPEFNLENPRTFDIVCEQTDIIGGNPNNPTISTNAILQEKLSHYLDTVEVHLIKEISLRSSSFFAALSNLQALHSETLECISQINNLREKLNRVDNTQAKKGLEVVRLKRRRANMGRLYEGLKMVSEIRSTQPMIQVLLGQGDYFSALDLIDEANNILHGDEGQRIQLEEKIAEQGTKNLGITNTKTTRLSNVSDGFKRSGTIDLRGVRALMHFSGQLTEMYKSIGVMMENDLLNMLFLDFEEHVENVNKSNTIRSLYNYKIPQSTKHGTTSINSIDSEIMENEDNLKKRITPLVLGLYRVNRLVSTLQAYRERILEEIKKIIQLQKHYPSNISHTDSREDQLGDFSKEQNSKVTKLLKGMTFDDFLSMLLSIYAVLLEGMKRIAIYNGLFTTILGNVEIYQIQIDADISEGEKKSLGDSDQTLENGSDVKDEQEIATPKNDSTSSFNKESKLKNDSNSSLDRLNISRKDSNSSLDKEENLKSDSSSSVNSTSSLNSRFSALKITTGIKSIIQKTSSLTSKSSLSAPPAIEKETTITSTLTKTKPKKSDSNSDSQSISDSAQIVYDVADLAHVRCANLIAVRADQNAQLNQKDFYRLFNVTSAFVLECEGLCGRMCYGLRGTIMSQAKAFLNHFHMERTRQAATLVENEQWVQEHVPIDYQRIVDKIVSAAISGLSSDFKDDPSNSTSSPISPVFPMTRFSTSSRDGENNTNDISNGTTKTPPVSQLNNDSSKYIFVEERRFFVVGCGLTLIKLLGDYLRCIANIPTLTTETMNRIVDILNLFNSRTCQVILGAGAMKSAGLKNITAKHLALASQSLGFMIVLIPFIRECIRHNLNAKQVVMLTEFDRIKRDYVNHQNEIHGKLVSIMGERLVIHLKSFQAIIWDEESAKEGPNQYMETLVKETTTLHKVLNKYLPPEVLQNVMTEVFNSSNTKLTEEIRKLKITTENGKKRLMTDAQYYTRKLSTLEGLQGPSNDLEIAVNNIQITDNSSKEDLSNTANTTTTNTSPPSSK